MQDFKISPLNLLRSSLNFPRPVYSELVKRTLKHCGRNFQWRLYFNDFIVAAVVAAYFLFHFASSRLIILVKLFNECQNESHKIHIQSTCCCLPQRGLKVRHAIQIHNQLKQIKGTIQFTNVKTYFLVKKIGINFPRT